MRQTEPSQREAVQAGSVRPVVVCAEYATEDGGHYAIAEDSAWQKYKIERKKESKV